MIVTADELAAFSGVTREDDDTLSTVYIENAGKIIEAYLGYDPETAEAFEDDEGNIVIPSAIINCCLRIASLLQLEEQNNLGINSKSFGDSGSRSFLNVTNYDPYLRAISVYRDGAVVI